MNQLPFFSRLYLVMQAMQKASCTFSRESSINTNEEMVVRATTQFANSEKSLKVVLAKLDKPNSYIVSFLVSIPSTNMAYDSGLSMDLNQEEMLRVRDFMKLSATKYIQEF